MPAVAPQLALGTMSDKEESAIGTRPLFLALYSCYRLYRLVRKQTKDHVILYVERAELKEPDAFYRECIRLGWHLLNGESFEHSFWRLYGKHPCKLWPRLYLAPKKQPHKVYGSGGAHAERRGGFREFSGKLILQSELQRKLPSNPIPSSKQSGPLPPKKARSSK